MYITRLLSMFSYQFLESRGLQGFSYFWNVISAPRKLVPFRGLTSFQVALKNNQYYFKKDSPLYYRSIQGHNAKSTSLTTKIN